MEQSEGIRMENREMREVFAQLERYIEDGYLLHGSKSRLPVLEPRQAQDDDRVGGVTNEKAVYASDDIRVPLFMALFDKKDPTIGEWRSFYTAIGADEMVVGGDNVTFTKGYVHVLPPDAFREVEDEKSREIIADETVEPVDCIEVDPSILQYLTGITYELEDF